MLNSCRMMGPLTRFDSCCFNKSFGMFSYVNQSRHIVVRANSHATPGLRGRLLSTGTGLLLFLWFYRLLSGPDPLAFDLNCRNWIHSFSSSSFTAIFLYCSRFGSWFFLLSIGVVISILFIDSFSDVRTWILTLYGAIVLSAALKIITHIARPDPFFGLDMPDTHSFPSAHALVSCCFFGLLAEHFCARTQSPMLRFLIWAAAAFAVTLIGVSRVYLGMQYPSSVLAGCAAGIAWLQFVRFAIERWFPNSPDDL
jgi:membrane-associated phospholipid phosphatase